LGRRAIRHEQTRQEIKQIARQQMVQQGTASLSLRGIAASMGMSAPSLYNYYANRDDLVTDLLVDSYSNLAEALEQASASCQTLDVIGCLLTTLLAHRQWAVDHPHEFALIAGSPIPGYVAPVEQTLPLGRRSMKVLLDLVQRAWDEQRLHPQSGSPAQSELNVLNEDFLTWCREQGYTFSVVVLFLELYALLQGMIALEVFGHLPFFIHDAVTFYRTAILTRLASDPLDQASAGA
jgi:AcrR family transcriptional regulator